MRNRGRILRAYKRLGLDRCPCEAKPLRTIVVMPGGQAPGYDHCARCGRASVLLIEIVYVEPDPPGWFIADLPGIDQTIAGQLWQEFIENHAVAHAGL